MNAVSRPPGQKDGDEASRPGLARLFADSLFLGLIGFGGGISVLGVIESLAVVRRRWMTPQDFVATATIAQMLPGGAAANALAAIGLRFQGLRGAAIAYTGFVLPGAVFVLGLAWTYVRFGAFASTGAFLSGLNAAVVGVILAIAVRMSRTSIRRLWQMGIAAAALVLSLVGGAGSGEVALLGIGIGLLLDLGRRPARLLRKRRRWKPSPPVALPEEGNPLQSKPGPARDVEEKDPPRDTRTPTLRSIFIAAPLLAVATPYLAHFLADLASLAVVFFRTGLGAYGGGFAIIPALHAQALTHHLLTERQFADAVAVGKLTPGPVLLMATFIGYLKAGLWGAIVSTIAILAAPFLVVVALESWLEQARSSRWVRAALRGLTPAVVGLMIAAALTLGSSIRTGISAAIAAVVALTLMRFDRVNPVVMLALGGIARLLFRVTTGG